MTIIRNRGVQISHENYWKARLLAKASHEIAKSDPMGNGGDGTDAIVDRILSGFFAERHPDLSVLWKRRAVIDDQGVAVARGVPLEDQS